MTEREKYFIRQKTYGVIFTILGIIPILFGAGIAAFIILPMSLPMIFSKRMIWMDEYFFKVQRMKERRKGSKN